MTDSTQPDGDAERLTKLRTKRDAIPIEIRNGAAFPPRYGFAWIDVDFLIQQIDSRDAALRERDNRIGVLTKEADLRAGEILKLDHEIQIKDAEIERLKTEFQETSRYYEGILRETEDNVPAPPQSDIERARQVYQTIEAFGWQVQWRHEKPVPDDAWPIDIIAAALSAARAEGEADRQQLQKDLENALLAISQVTKTASEYEFARGYARAVEDATRHATEWLPALIAAGQGHSLAALIDELRAPSPQPREDKP